MADEEKKTEEKAPIIVKKIKKGGHGHHGGAWKIAYADFVTAMMAFFLLMWLLNSVTQETLEGVADYFSPASISESNSGAGGVLGGKSIIVPGAKVSPMDVQSQGAADDGSGQSEDDLDSLMEQMEEEMFNQAESELRMEIENNPEFKGLEENLIIDRTEEGLRIQIVDKNGRDMFRSGGSEPSQVMRKLLSTISKVISKLPNQISVTGHTDASPLNARGGKYTNWELSSERANASRFELINSGLDRKKVNKIIGKAAKDPLLKDDPSSSVNRRISIILLKDAALRAESSPLPPSLRKKNKY